MPKPPPKFYNVELPTKTYLRKFVSGKNITILDYNSTLGTLILCLLDKKIFNTNMNDEDMTRRLQYMNDKIVFTCSINTLFYKGLILTCDKIIAINRYIEHSFVEELHMWCRSNTANRIWRPGIDKAIYSFAEKYQINIDEDITFDALKKAEYRHRQRLEVKLKSFVPPKKPPTSMYAYAV